MTSWTIKGFEDLTVSELYLIMRARQHVFVVEQRNSFLDADGFDEHSLHLWAPSRQGFKAYCRIIPPGIRFPKPSIGRVLVSAARRRNGIGRDLIKKALSEITKRWPGQVTVIGASPLYGFFYESLGFFPIGSPYLEDGVELVEMHCNPAKVRSTGRMASS